MRERNKTSKKLFRLNKCATETLQFYTNSSSLLNGYSC